MATPTDGSSNAARSCRETCGRPGAGSPAGIWPTTAMPCSSSEKAATTAVAASTPIRATGARGTTRSKTSNSASTDIDNTTVGQCTADIPAMNDRTWSRNSSPLTLTLVSLPSWLPIITNAMPAM